MADAYQQALTGAVVFDQSDRGKVIVAGVDARAFLHNLSTNDIKGMKPGTSCEAFFATAQAKAVAYARIFYAESNGAESFWLDLDPDQNEKVRTHLDRYIISEQVELTDVTEEYCQWHLTGPKAGDVLGGAGTNASGQTRCCDRLNLPGWDVLCRRSQSEQTYARLAERGAMPAGPDVFHALRIEAGMPVYGIDIDENRFVVEVGRTKQAISYTKGCYLGQEPIVMARDRGHANRTLLGLRVRSDAPLPPGTKLKREAKEVGEVSSSVISPRFGTIALAYIRRGNQEPGTVLQWATHGLSGSAEVVSLPFTA
jgi:folate-binding protein YgfZ